MSTLSGFQLDVGLKVIPSFGPTAQTYRVVESICKSDYICWF